jgi:serine/threonine-protein kinase
MRYVPGMTLESLLAQAGFRSTRQDAEAIVHRALRALSEICRTIAFAHRQGIVHCDVKPGNVLLGDCGETALLDWGLAAPFASNGATSREFHISHGSTLRTLTNDRGTARFMSPERAERSGEFGPWTDIYSLGVILDMIAHGEFEASSGAQEAGPEDRSLGPPPSPYPLDPTLRRRLLALADVACAMQPSRRPKSADDLAQEIDRIIDDRSRGGGGWGSFLRRFRRSRS